MGARFSLNHFWQRLGVAAIVAALCFAPLTPFRLAGFFLAAGVLPGVGIASRSRFRAAESIGLGTAISPVVFGVCVLVAMWTGAAVHTAAWTAAGVSLLLFVLAWRGGTANEDATDRRALAGLAIVVLIAAVMCFALPLAKLWWRARSDSWFHAAVTNKLLRDGLPVTDPYFAGLRLQYMYFYHSIFAACVSITRIDALHAMIVVNAIALVSCATAFHALAGMFSRRLGPRVLGAALWLFGMNGWFYFFYVTRIVRAFSGENHGMAALRALFPWSPNGHATAMALISVEGNQFMFLDKFMLGTAFSLTFSLAAAVLFLLLGARRGAWSVRHDAVLFFCAAGTMLLHPMTGITLAAVTAAVLALLLLVRSQTARGGPSYARLVGILAAGVAVTVPYVRSVAPGKGSDAMAFFSFQPVFALGLVADILPALVLAILFLRHAGEDTDTPERLGARPFLGLTLSGTGLLVAWFLFMLVVALTVDLTSNNETKFSFFLWLPLCALAVGYFDRAWESPSRRRLVLAVVASATLPLHALYFHHAVRDRSTLAISDQERAVYQWIEKSTPRDAVFIEESDNVRVPVLGDRDTYWGTEVYAHNWGYPPAEMSARRDLRDHIFSKDGPGDDDILQLRGLGRRVFVIYRMKENDLIDPKERFQANSRLRGRFTTSEAAVWEVVLD
jgi:hypothetical protein